MKFFMRNIGKQYTPRENSAQQILFRWLTLGNHSTNTKAQRQIQLMNENR